MRLLAVPPNDVPAIAHLLQHCCGAGHVRHLSEAAAVRQEVQGEERPEPTLQDLLRRAAPTLARLLYRASPTRYFEALDSKVHAQQSLDNVLSMDVLGVERVVDCYSLPGCAEVQRQGAVSLRVQPHSGRLQLLVAAREDATRAAVARDMAQAVAGGGGVQGMAWHGCLGAGHGGQLDHTQPAFDTVCIGKGYQLPLASHACTPIGVCQVQPSNMC